MSLRTPSRPRGFSLVEATVSIVIVGIMLTAALNTVGASKMSLLGMSDRARGAMLAQDLMSEILQQAYEEPDDTVSFGRESGESGGSRAGYDDVDDYHNWSTKPPQNKDGTAIPDLDGWKRIVSVLQVDPADLPQSAFTDTGVKQITVTVKHHRATVATLIAVRTSAWQDPLGSIGAGGPPVSENNPPNAVAMGNPLTGLAPLNVMFAGAGSSDPDGDTLTYDWDFGDGNTASGQMVSHIYTSPGSYDVILTVSDGNGGTDTDTLSIEVN